MASPPIPLQDAIAKPRKRGLRPEEKDYNEGRITDAWVKYFQDQTNTFSTSPNRVGSAQLTTQAASISTTSVSTASLPAGLYRLSYYARISRAATVSSSLIVTLGWTDDAVTVTASGVAMIGNTTATAQGASFMVEIDQASPIVYSTTYASVGGTTMQYKLDVVVEQMLT